ncbi:MAG TPA: amidophosphoribosyltransferase [Methanomassiliicoccales archaeon]|nr:amidophosphoribosyltransferase [Methanomassiliicoccales archaeon]HOO03525.1 amidophosphoribosyltransferase [Methanomassiliicoccales archaeon]HRU11166.1 amidophosphoribosyltransferase [Methanomassiliicoccales archaeon]
MEDDRPKHFCGVVGMALEGDAVPHLKKALRIIQHRGQESAGIAVSTGGAISYVRGMGLVHEVLTGRQYNALAGNRGIGHVRYSTSGSSCAENCQPITVTTKEGDLALAHNGDIVNAGSIRDKLQSEGWAFLTSSDSEIIVRMLATELSNSPDPVRAIKTVMRTLEGAYSITMMLDGRVFGFRDPFGFRPLCLGRLPGGYALASESAVFDVLKGEFIRDVQPGEIVEISSSGATSTRTPAAPHCAHCMFEWVYFARPDAVIEGREVYQVRTNIGHILAKEQPVEADVVVPVPDSGRAHALGFAEGSGIPYAEGFMKNRYIERTFILPDQSQRDEGVLLKLNPIRSTVAGKRVVIVDDSIVRGTTMLKIVQMTRRAGAKEVHVRIGCPPVIAPCFYGVDMKTREQFAALNRTPKQIAELITADSVGYISQAGLVRALGIPESELCLACVNGEYPTRIAGEKMRFQRTLEV